MTRAGGQSAVCPRPPGIRTSDAALPNSSWSKICNRENSPPSTLCLIVSDNSTEQNQTTAATYLVPTVLKIKQQKDGYMGREQGTSSRRPHCALSASLVLHRRERMSTGEHGRDEVNGTFSSSLSRHQIADRQSIHDFLRGSHEE
jgi:hypothetical protein